VGKGRGLKGREGSRSMLLLAGDIVQAWGKALVGRKILTFPMGEYTGGEAVITKISPDRATPDIAFIVKNDSWEDDQGSHEIGVFGHEEVDIHPFFPATTPSKRPRPPRR
jgi:hypothetical protein